MAPNHDKDYNDDHRFIERLPAQDGWDQYSRFVLKELIRLSDTQEVVRNKVSKIETDIALLQLKAGMAGVIAGIIVTIIGRYMTR